jgi:hypothetical protein
MARLLTRLRSRWAARAQLGGNVVGASTERLLDLLGRDGVTTRYGSRRFLEDALIELLYAVNPTFDNPAFRHKLEHWVRQIAFKATQDVGLTPVHYFLSYGGYRRLGLPLVKPAQKLAFRLEDMFHDLLAMLPSAFHEKYPNLPASLLIRLLVWAGVYNRATLALEANPALTGVLTGGLVIEPPTVADRVINGTPFGADTTELDRLVFTEPNPPSNPPARAILNQLRTALKPILATFANLDHELPRLERIFRATLDSAMFRLDPWVMGLAWHRLEQLSQDPGARRRMGVYGWVDGPILGTPGPTDGGLLHTPSHGQAITALILRDKYLSEKQEAPPPAHNPWAMNLASKPIREAGALAEEVRLGAHLWEVVGRQVERVVGTTAAVEKLRVLSPMRDERKDAAVVCNGMDALQRLLAGPVDGIPLSSLQRESLADLQSALDVYGDLLVCEAVYQVVHSKGEAAGATMDAAIGLHRPPELQFVKTSRQGRALHTSVLCILPLHNPPEAVTADTSPGLVADPSVAGLLVELFGEAAQWTWETIALPVVRVSLADLGLAPVDAVSLGPETLTALARAAAGIPDGQKLGGSALEKHRRARQLVQAVGRHPCLFRDLARVGPGEPLPADVVARDDLLRGELLGRYNMLRAAAKALQAALDGAADDATRRACLRSAVRWGIVPILADAPPAAVWRAIFAAAPTPDELVLLQAATKAASAALASRLKIASTPPNDQPPNAAQVAAAIAELASPGGTVAVLSTMDRTELLARTGIRPAQSIALEADWLSTMAAVRPSMARFEAWQLESAMSLPFSPLSARTNDDDPWLKAVVQANEQAKDMVGGLQFPRFVAAYGTTATWNPTTTKFAVGLIDSWGETVPARAHSTTAAFGFNAPAARAPQAILLAAPPIADQPLDDETLRDIVIETRELAHARAVAFEQLGEFQALTPLAMLPGTGSSAFRTTP